MKNKITTKLGKDGFVDLSAFKDLLPISKIKYYSMKLDGEVIVVRFYDSKRKLIKLKQD